MNATFGRLSKRTMVAKRRSKIARWLVMFLVRLGGQAQSSDLPSHQFPTAHGFAVRPGGRKFIVLGDHRRLPPAWARAFWRTLWRRRQSAKSTGAGFDGGVIPCQVSNLTQPEPNGVLPASLCTAFTELRDFMPQLQNQFHDGTIQRSQLAQTSRRAFRLNKRLSAPALSALCNFWVLQDGGLTP
jgi:hypothetical protein